MKLLFSRFATFIYVVAATVLILLALMIMTWSVYEVVEHIRTTITLEKGFILVMLQAVGAIVISVAVVDVARYMIEEEVFRFKEIRTPREARETLTKIMLIVLIAVSIEGLVYTFKAGTTDLRLLIYPSLLILTSVLIMVGIGIYQRLSVEAENRVDSAPSPPDETSEGEPGV